MQSWRVTFRTCSRRHRRQRLHVAAGLEMARRRCAGGRIALLQLRLRLRLLRWRQW